MSEILAVPIDKLKEYVGKEIGVSDWVQIDQDRINAFAECTGDHQWIHVNEEMAAKGPFGKTIAHGYLTLALIPAFTGGKRVFPEGIKMAINYGANKIRFLTPVTVGSKVRNRTTIKEVTEKGSDKLLMAVENSIEIEGVDKLAMVAETLTMFFF